MIFPVAITLLVVTHVIYRRGKNGCRLSLKLEKVAVLLAALASLAAIIELCSSLGTLLVADRSSLEGWLPELLVYPAGLILFLFVVLVVLPKPIAENGEESGHHPPARSKMRD